MMKDLSALGLFENREYTVIRVPYGQHELVGMKCKFDRHEMEFVTGETPPRYIPLFKVIMDGYGLKLSSDVSAPLLDKHRLMARNETMLSCAMDSIPSKEDRIKIINESEKI